MNPAPETPDPDVSLATPPVTPAPVPAALVPVLSPAVGTPAPLPAKRGMWALIATRRFLFISILVHVVFALVATGFIVQTITAQRKLTFVAAPPSPNRSTRATEHRVEMAQKQKTMSAPAQAQRITTTAADAKVALPTMPAMPSMSSALTPAKMAGLGGAGFGMGAMGAPGAGSGTNGGPVQFFGLRTGGVGLSGTFYDLKQTPNKQPTKMTPESYIPVVEELENNGFNVTTLSKYYKGDKPLYTTQIWIPQISADLGPSSFGLEKEVQPKMWIVHYKGIVTAPASFRFHFVGAGDDVMLVKFNGKLVLGYCWKFGKSWKPVASYDYGYSGTPGGFAKGDMIQVEAGRSYPIEIVIGERPGGSFFATLLQEIEGTTYEKDSKGNPILPVFRMSNAAPPAAEKGQPFPPHRDDGPIWKATPDISASAPGFSH